MALILNFKSTTTKSLTKYGRPATRIRWHHTFK